ncbi:hypothetical protein TanjilG_31529 [Lupinus angustifolius]|uniref:Bet v I/Major latex protein domain-containing protein n=1 Tax=Lupinus angustifolius TaxID=3871 RepID=A0A4P1RUG0_LUPAN|nr:hypothetical protein TanjilG_31529 [Lupinus angustifolius]
MGVFTFENESTSTVAPARLYKALVIDADIIIPKAIEAIQSVEIVEGEETKYVLHKIEAIDEANLGYNYSIVGGVGLPDTLETLSIKTRLVEGANGGSIGKVTITIESKGDAQPNEKKRARLPSQEEMLFSRPLRVTFLPILITTKLLNSGIEEKLSYIKVSFMLYIMFVLLYLLSM